jgi:hypothetical protein
LFLSDDLDIGALLKDPEIKIIAMQHPDFMRL